MQGYHTMSIWDEVILDDYEIAREVDSTNGQARPMAVSRKRERGRSYAPSGEGEAQGVHQKQNAEH